MKNVSCIKNKCDYECSTFHHHVCMHKKVHCMPTLNYNTSAMACKDVRSKVIQQHKLETLPYFAVIC